MATWTVAATVLAVEAGGEVLRLRVELGAGVLTDAHVRLAQPDAPHEPLRPGPAARRWVEWRLPPGARVWFVSDRRDRAGRPMGKLLYHHGGGRRRDLAVGLLEAGHAVPPRRQGRG